VQEALTTALKHAGPPTVHVRVRYGSESLELEVVMTDTVDRRDGVGRASRARRHASAWRCMTALSNRPRTAVLPRPRHGCRSMSSSVIASCSRTTKPRARGFRLIVEGRVRIDRVVGERATELRPGSRRSAFASDVI